MAKHKREHLNHQLAEKISQLLLREINDPRFAKVTITGVTVAKDLSVANVRFCVFQSDQDIDQLTEALNKAAGFFSHQLGKSLTIRHTPRIQFHYDHGFDHADRIEELLKS